MRLFLLLMLACLSLLFAATAKADVIVLDNRTTSTVSVRVEPVTSTPFQIRIESGDLQPVYVDGKAHVAFSSRGVTKRYLLDANSAYYFGAQREGSVDLQKLGLGGSEQGDEGRPLPGSARNLATVVIPVKLLVDEEEPAKRAIWERRLRRRIDRAADIFEHHCNLRFKVVAVETWNSENSITAFFESLKEFEEEVNPFPGQLAIGFTSQYQVPKGRVHLGGTRGLFHSHILLREWSRHVGEPERLELLVHELGHFMGAAHSPEPGSVMRPVLGDRLANYANFRIRFDPVNTLLMAMITEEMSRRNVREAAKLSRGTARRMAEILSTLSGSPTQQKERVLKNPQRVSRRREKAVPPLVAATQSVLASVVSSARQNYELPTAGGDADGGPARVKGDALMELYVRTAATAAQDAPEKLAPTAFLLALGIVVDDKQDLEKIPQLQPVIGMIESAGQRSVRMAFLGKPTMRGRQDLAKHFAISAFLTASAGKAAAQTSGHAKEILDSRSGGSGFSFADIAANRAGIHFAEKILEQQLALKDIGQHFQVRDYLPEVDQMPEGLSAAQLNAKFGQVGEAGFQGQLEQIEQMILDLPAYRGLQSAAKQPPLDPAATSP